MKLLFQKADQSYKHYVLKRVQNHYDRKRPEYEIHNIRLFHEHVPADKSQIVRSFLKKKRFMFCPILPLHPICEFFSPKLELGRMRICFKERIGLNAINQYINTIPKKYMNAFKAWINLLNWCVSVNGE